MDKIDRAILGEIQTNFPIDPEPYKVLADRLSLTEDEVCHRIRNLKSKRIIRRIGASFDSGRVGYVSTLIAMKVPETRIEEVGHLTNQYAGVTHNYLRPGDYNLWFTLITPSVERKDEILQEIKTKTGIDELMDLPSKQRFKIEVNLEV
ncbi:MAG: AsnC family transcriptional regulator [bacterium]|nr:AsnC family transcriptional regulator [bacterium]